MHVLGIAIGLALQWLVCVPLERLTQKDPRTHGRRRMILPREIDHVLAANPTESVRRMHSSYCAIWHAIGVEARALAAAGLHGPAQKLNEKRRALDAEWALEMTRAAAKES